MKHTGKHTWLIWGMTILTLFINVFVLSAATKNLDLLWILAISIPLFILTIYFSWQTIPYLLNYLFGKKQSTLPVHQFELLPGASHSDRITTTDLEVQIGNNQCSQPYKSLLFNVSSMEKTAFGSFNEAEVETDPGYPGYSVDEKLDTYHMATGGYVWQIGPNYIGCCTENKHFNSKAFRKNAHRPEIKMIELNLSKDKNTGLFLGITAPVDTGNNPGKVSPSTFTSFHEAEGMIHFLDDLRGLSGGKPVGIRVFINNKKEFYKVCHAIRKTKVYPDFIVVEGMIESAGTVSSNKVSANRMRLYEAVLFTSQTLEKYGLVNKICVIAHGKVGSCLDIIKLVSLGADIVHTDIPRYKITKHSRNGRNVAVKLENSGVYDFHNCLVSDTVQMMRTLGFRNAGDITLAKFFDSLDTVNSKRHEDVSDSLLGSFAKKEINPRVETKQTKYKLQRHSIK